MCAPLTRNQNELTQSQEAGSVSPLCRVSQDFQNIHIVASRLSTLPLAQFRTCKSGIELVSTLRTKINNLRCIVFSEYFYRKLAGQTKSLIVTLIAVFDLFMRSAVVKESFLWSH